MDFEGYREKDWRIDYEGYQSYKYLFNYPK